MGRCTTYQEMVICCENPSSRQLQMNVFSQNARWQQYQVTYIACPTPEYGGPQDHFNLQAALSCAQALQSYGQFLLKSGLA